MATKIHNEIELLNDIKKKLSSGDKQISNLFKGSDGVNYAPINRDELDIATKALEEYLRDWIRDYFDSYTPSVYKRTGRFIQSVNSVITSEQGQLKAIVYFGSDGSIRDSLWDGQPKGDVVALLNEGWHVSSGWHKDIAHFGYQDGFNFIELAVAEAKRDVRFKNIDIRIHKESSI